MSADGGVRPPVGGTTEHRRMVSLTVTPYDHSDGEVALTGMRGVRLNAATGFTSGRVFSTAFPTVYVSESGDVEMGSLDLLVTRDRAADWFAAVAEFLANGAAS